MRVVAVLLAAAAALTALPWIGASAFIQSFLYLLFHWIVLAVSWNILSGYTGYFSFGHGVFFGAGVYGTAYLAGRLDWPFLATLPAAMAIAAAIGIAIGLVVFRLRAVRGEVFALLTLAVGFVVATIILNTRIDGGPGIYLLGLDVPPLAPTPAGSLYLLGLLACLATLLIAHGVHRSKLGAGLFAIHDDEDVAEVMGVPTYRFKLVALALSCALAGLAGGIHAAFVSYVTVSETFSIAVPLSVVLMSVLGGRRHWAGPAVGAVIITSLLYVVTAGQYAVIGRAAVGLILVVVILLMPGGVIGMVRTRLQRRRPKRARGEAPSSAPIRAIERSADAGDALLVVQDLSKAFKGVQALAAVSLQVRRGEILGLIGPNGSGKSTFINVVSGHYRADAGVIRFEGADLAGHAAHAIAGAGIARTYQIPRPFMEMTVLENVAMAGMFGRAGRSRAAAMAEAHRHLAAAGLGDKAEWLPAELNLHQRKFLELARALAAEPKLLLLDEVLSGLTPTEIDGAIAAIRGIRDRGTTIVFVEHVMRAVMALADRIVVLHHGELIAAGEPAAVMEDPLVRTAYLGHAHA
jgi:branched-chain amino acid transport system permease protein